MKKLWIINHYATDMYNNEGGRHYWFVKYLKKMGYDPLIICANTFHNKIESIEMGNEKILVKQKNGIDFLFLKTTPAVGNGLDRIKNMLFFYISLIRHYKKIIKKMGKPELIIASSVHPLTMVAGLQIGKWLKIPCVCEVRDLWPEAIFQFNKIEENSFMGKLLVKGEKWIYEKADSIIFTKEGDIDYLEEKKWLKEYGGFIDRAKVHYINNGVDINEFNRIKLKYANDNYDAHDTNNKFSVVYCGSIRPVNGVNKIVEAAKILEKYNDIEFLIYGEGNEKENIEKYIEENELKNVKLKGFVEKKYIPSILEKSSVNLLNYSGETYNWERGNSSNKLFEYMASGKPIISTVKMGYSLIKKYECGLELEQGDADELADAIIRIKNLSSIEYNRMSQNALTAAKDFDFKILTTKLVEVIEKHDGQISIS